MELSEQVWLVTGCSSGFGREIVLAALAAGARVVVTARNTTAIEDICQRYPQRSIAVALDVTDSQQIHAAVAATLEHFGRIDVLVNNAGYGYVGAIEEGEDDQVRAMFEANFFGALVLTKAVLPYMRKQRSGRIINNSSQAGIMANPGTGYYSASKYAMEGMMEALGKEVAPFNIFVSSVQAGAFRTDWSGRSMQRTQNTIADYQQQVASRIDMIAAYDGKQPGDPVRAAQTFLMLATMVTPPPQLLLGAACWRVIVKNWRRSLNN
ncbi:oxidoreductase [Oceanicoccus sp. KOV_DT_Chl]|uniref:oxidoreductase n=1 Tax=Oceanicoccus sp. KOV_DT_Chl TaxID=1904639 RepID=UPI00190EBB66|nr:oxidoreductase [Oceanicoccus sp. KOV_DT_Chl]